MPWRIKDAIILFWSVLKEKAYHRGSKDACLETSSPLTVCEPLCNRMKNCIECDNQNFELLLWFSLWHFCHYCTINCSKFRWISCRNKHEWCYKNRRSEYSFATPWISTDEYSTLVNSKFRFLSFETPIRMPRIWSCQLVLVLRNSFVLSLASSKVCFLRFQRISCFWSCG